MRRICRAACLPPTRPVSPGQWADEEEAPAVEKQEQHAQQGAEADGAAAVAAEQAQAGPSTATARRRASSREAAPEENGEQGKVRQQQAPEVALPPQPVPHTLPGGADIAAATLLKHTAAATSPATPAAQPALPVPQPSPSSAALVAGRVAEVAQRKVEQAMQAFAAADRTAAASMLLPLQHLLRALDEQAGEALQVGCMGKGAAVAWLAWLECRRLFCGGPTCFTPFTLPLPTPFTSGGGGGLEQLPTRTAAGALRRGAGRGCSGRMGAAGGAVAPGACADRGRLRRRKLRLRAAEPSMLAFACTVHSMEHQWVCGELVVEHERELARFEE